jgi:hypothetical protein
MRHQRLFAILGLMATLCLGLAWAGGAVQGQDSPPNGSPTFAPPGVVFPTATPPPLPVTTTPTPAPTQLGLGGPGNAGLAVVSPYTYIGPTYAVIAQSDTAGFDAAMARANLISITAPAYQIFTLGGVYRPTQTYVMEKNVEIIGEGIDQTIIDRDSAIANTQMATFFVIRDDNPNDATPISMTLRNLTVRNGLATAIGLAEYGGGLSVQSGATLRIFDAKIENNQALLYGGGIYNQGGKVVLERVIMVGNKGGQGGGFYNHSVLANALTATCVRFKGNGVVGSPGGGVAASYSSAIIRHSSFIGNIGFGADIYNNFFASTDAKNNYWAATPNVSGSVNVSLPYPAGQDPTLPYDTPSLWYDPTAYTVYPNCVMRPPPAFPPVLQATPTPTPVPPTDPCPNLVNNLWRTALVAETTPVTDRKICWREYRGIIAMTMFHELSENQYFDISQLNGMGLTSSFATVNVPHSHLYLFARTMVNGMIKNYVDSKRAETGINPMEYFAKNYSSTISVEQWVGGGFDGCIPYKTKNFTGGCSEYKRYNTFFEGKKRDEPNGKWAKAFDIFLPFIEQAINDFVDNKPDPTLGATSVLPANRCYRVVDPSIRVLTTLEIIERYPETGANIYGYRNGDCTGSGQNGPFTFGTKQGSVVNIVFYDPHPPKDYLNNAKQCQLVGESLEQAYMRHLRKMYRTSYYDSPTKITYPLTRKIMRIGFPGPTTFIHTLRVEESTLTWVTFTYVQWEGASQATPLFNNGQEYFLPNITALDCP